jgi:hypothetical protein
MKVSSEQNHFYNPPESPFKKGGLKKPAPFTPFSEGG